MRWSTREKTPRRRRAGLARRGRAGFALMLVMVMIFVVFVLGMGYLCSASVRMASSNNWIVSARARYASEAGLEHAKHILYTNPGSASSITQASPMGPYVLEGNAVYRFYFTPGAGTNQLYTAVGVGGCGKIGVACSTTIRARNIFAATLENLSPRNYWRLGETSGTQAHDEESQNNGWYQNGVALGQAGPLLADTDKCAQFDGSNDYVDLDSFNLSGSAMTIVAWVKPGSDTLDGRNVIAKPDGNAVVTCWGLGAVYASSRNQALFRLRTTSGATTSLSGGTLTANQWTFLAAVYNGSNMVLYQDGNEVARTAKTGSIKSGTMDVWIGGNSAGAAANRWLGWLDEAALFQSALSADQVKSLWDAKNPELTTMSWSE
jgi:hypothetical protein